MEASALNAPARLARLSASSALLRLRSDEQLVALLRGGSRDAFEVIHDRYRQRLFAYVRQMLGQRSPQDAEDLLQEVFARSYTALRADQRPIHLRPWLYRVAHNLCVDHMRRPIPVPSELREAAGKPLHDPFEHVKRREDLSQLVADISRLPAQQKSALLLREINGLSYNELAEALEVSVAAVKSLLVRARVELVETAEARDVACGSIREELLLVCDSGGRASPRTRRHLRDCAECRTYRGSVQGLRRAFAALSPVAAFGPLALLGKLAGIGGSSGGTAAGATSLSAGGSVGLGAASAAKVAAVVSIAAVAAGGAVEIERRVSAEPESSRAAPASGSPTVAPAGATPTATGWWRGATPFAPPTTASGNAFGPASGGSTGSGAPAGSTPAPAKAGNPSIAPALNPFELGAVIPAAPLMPVPAVPGDVTGPTPSPAGDTPDPRRGADPVLPAPGLRSGAAEQTPARRPQTPKAKLPPAAVARPRSPDAPAFIPPPVVAPKSDRPAKRNPPVRADKPGPPARPNPSGRADKPRKPNPSARLNAPRRVDEPAAVVQPARPEAPGRPLKVDKPAKGRTDALSETGRPGRSPRVPGVGLSP